MRSNPCEPEYREMLVSTISRNLKSTGAAHLGPGSTALYLYYVYELALKVDLVSYQSFTTVAFSHNVALLGCHHVVGYR